MKLIKNALLASLFGLSLMSYAEDAAAPNASDCGCSQECHEKCAKGDTKDCKCKDKDCDCKKSKHCDKKKNQQTEAKN